MEKEKTIIIANTAEAFKDQLLESGNTAGGQARIRHELALSQRAFFWAEDDKIIITPYIIPEELFHQNTNLLELTNTENWSPSQTDLDLSSAISNDHQLLDRITELVKAGTVTFSPYTLTPGLAHILVKLKQLGLSFKTDVENMELTKYLSSKAGFREIVSELAKSHPEVKLPEGYACEDQYSAIEKALWFLGQKRSCVIKANMGESGWGLIVLREDRFGAEVELKSSLQDSFQNDNIWSNTIFVVEEFIKSNKEIDGGSPSTEIYVSGDGAKITYTCGQLVGENGEFLGVTVGSDVVEKKIREQLERAALAIGNRYWQLGYQGFFDIDFVISESSIPFAVETNARRTGGTHVYDLGRRLLGKDIAGWGCMLSEDAFQYSKESLPVESILNTARGLMYSPISKRGVVLTLINPSDPILGYVAIGYDKDDAIRLQSDFKRLWERAPVEAAFRK